MIFNKIFKGFTIILILSFTVLGGLLFPLISNYVVSEKEATENQYVTITYQDVYDYVLKALLEFSTDSKVNLIVSFYIHSLCCYDSNNLIGLVVTDEEQKSLENLFTDAQILNMIESLCNNERNEYTKYYKQNKATFIKIFNKYLHIIEDEELRAKIVKVLNTKSYILNGTYYRSIAQLLQELLEFLLLKHTIEELHEIVYLVSEVDPLLVSEEELLKVEHKSWYLDNPKPINYNGNKYYVLSSWASHEYDILKYKVNELSRINPEIYGSITLE